MRQMGAKCGNWEVQKKERRRHTHTHTRSEVLMRMRTQTHTHKKKGGRYGGVGGRTSALGLSERGIPKSALDFVTSPRIQNTIKKSKRRKEKKNGTSVEKTWREDDSVFLLLPR